METTGAQLDRAHLILASYAAGEKVDEQHVAWARGIYKSAGIADPSSSPEAAAGIQEADVVLGYLADGSPITPATAGGDPGFLSRPGLVLNEAGRAVKRHLEELAHNDPFLRAKELGIDLEAVRAAAVRMRKPFLQVLMAELDFRDQAAAAYAHPAVRGL